MKKFAVALIILTVWSADAPTPQLCSRPDYRQVHLAECNQPHTPGGIPGGPGGGSPDGGLLGGLLGGLTGGLL